MTRSTDAAVAADRPLLVPAEVKLTGIDTTAEQVSALLRELVRPSHRRTARGEDTTSQTSLVRELAGLDEADRLRRLTEVLRAEIAAVLGHSDATPIDPRLQFQALGFDSLSAVELRNTLTRITGKPLPATLLFDFPTPQDLAAHLHAQLAGVRTETAAPAAPRKQPTADDPVVIVGMGCRFPGGSPRRTPCGTWPPVGRTGCRTSPSTGAGTRRWSIRRAVPAKRRGPAPDGRCKFFAEVADGTAWAEGAGVLVLERLSTARRLGHQVFAVVAGSAVNQDGASNGLTAPNGPSQQQVIRSALANAGLTTFDMDAVEAHDAGTKLGDPIEE